MIGVNFAVEQVRRLRVTNYFAMLDEASVGELARMLTYAANEIIAVAVINQWIEEQTERPTPADLRRLVAVCNEAREQDEPPVLAFKCARCQDSGMRGGDIGGPEARPWEWCDCAGSKLIRSNNPTLVRDANAVRKRLLLSPRALKTVSRGHQNVSDVYRDV